MQWWNVHIRFPESERIIFYEVLLAQLDAGLTMKDILALLSQDFRLSPEVTALTVSGYQAVSEGRRFTDGFRESNLLPTEVVELLNAAEQKDTISSVLRNLIASSSCGSLSFVKTVILSNLYYLMMACVLLFLSLNVLSFVEPFKNFVNLDANDAYQMSVVLNAYFLPTLIGIIISVLSVWILTCQVYPLRIRIPYFTTHAQLLYGMKYASIAGSFSKIGMTHIEIIDVCDEIFHRSGFMRGALNELRARVAGEGDSFTEVLGETVLNKDISRVFSALVPRGERGAYGNAYTAIEKLQEKILRRMNTKGKVVIQFFLLVATAYMMLTLFIGLYSLYDF